MQKTQTLSTYQAILVEYDKIIAHLEQEREQILFNIKAIEVAEEKKKLK